MCLGAALYTFSIDAAVAIDARRAPIDDVDVPRLMALATD
jgi:hypothetical protein